MSVEVSRIRVEAVPAAPCGPTPAAGALDEDALASAAAKKWLRPFSPRLVPAHQADVRLVDQGGRLERLAGFSSARRTAAMRSSS